ncbi:MAG: serine protease [Bacteroidetes bacterium]|nr:MAG: serine protease [Bacteroidota bacterium]
MKPPISRLLDLLLLPCIFLFLTYCSGEDRPLPPHLHPDEKALQAALDRFVAIYRKGSKQAVGSGLLLNSSGQILSCLHIVKMHSVPLAASRNARDFSDLRVIKRAPKRDLVLFASDLKRELPPLGFRSSDSLVVGESVYAFGAPWGLSRSYLQGYIAHQGRNGIDQKLPGLRLIQTMGLSYPGTSGAGIYDAQGRLIGLNRATYGFVVGNGIGFAVPSSTLQAFLDQ